MTFSGPWFGPSFVGTVPTGGNAQRVAGGDVGRGGGGNVVAVSNPGALSARLLDGVAAPMGATSPVLALVVVAVLAWAVLK